MKKKFKVMIVTITMMLFASLALSTSYGLWKIESNKQSNTAIVDSGCVEIIYSDQKEFNLISPPSTKDEDGPRTPAKTVSITNKCSEIKTIELAMDILPSSTIDSSKIKVFLNGDYDLTPTLLSNVKQLKNTDEAIKEKRLLLKYDIEPSTTNRLNIRMWLDQDATITDDKNSFYTNYYVSANNQIIKPTLSEKVIADNNGEEAILTHPTPDYTIAATTDEGLIKVENAYYFRGAVLNNYFQFANLNWRVAGINADKSLKLIYSGEKITSSFNKSNKEENLGFTNSNMQAFLNDWYIKNLSSYDEFIVNESFCNDTSNTSNYNRINYGAYSRIYESSSPSLQCPATEKNYGGAISSKIGLITIDEAMIAGATNDMPNESFYLFTGESFYTMSPAYSSYTSNMAIVNSKGKTDDMPITYDRQVQPVINLNSSLNLKGNGTIDNPYMLDLED